jgi:phosphatidylserine decarboxylase
MIKFGSCTEIVVPLNVDIKVKVGDKAKAGSTIIGIINNAEK